MEYPKIYYVMIVIGFALITGGGLSRSFLPLLSRELDPSGLLVGFAMSSYHFIRMFVEIPSGFISDRMGRRTPVIVGLGLSTVGAVICGVSTSIYQLIVGRAVWGLGASLYFTNNISLVIDLFDPSIRGKALGNLHGIEMIGSLIGQPAGAFIADIVGFQNVFYISALSIAVSFLFAWTSREFKDADTHRVQRDTSLLASLRGVKNRGLFFVSLVRMLRMIITMGVVMTAFPLFLTDHLALTVTMIGLVMTGRTVAFMLATFSGGHVTDRIGLKPTAIVGIVIEASTLLLYSLVPSPALIFILVFIGGFGSGLFQIALALLMSLQMEERFIGSGVGIYRTFQDAGSVIGPILMMLIADAIGIRSTFLFGFAAYLVSIPLILLTRQAKDS